MHGVGSGRRRRATAQTAPSRPTVTQRGPATHGTMTVPGCRFQRASAPRVSAALDEREVVASMVLGIGARLAGLERSAARRRNRGTRNAASTAIRATSSTARASGRGRRSAPRATGSPAHTRGVSSTWKA